MSKVQAESLGNKGRNKNTIIAALIPNIYSNFIAALSEPTPETLLPSGIKGSYILKSKRNREGLLRLYSAANYSNR